MTSAALLDQARAVRQASRRIAATSYAMRQALVVRVAELLDSERSVILAVNTSEVDRFNGAEAARDRLVLNETRIDGMVSGLRAIAQIPDVLGEVVAHDVRPNGLRVDRVRVPLGVVGVIYENRPNVTMDVAALCVMSGNAAFLRGSSSALESNKALVSLWHRAAEELNIALDVVSLVADSSHEAAAEFMGLVGYIDCLIPRGGPSLIDAMRQHAKVPYVLDGDGNCHVYIDASADLEMALSIAVNAKTSRPGVCNAAETLLVHRDIATEFLPALAERFSGVEIRGDELTCTLIDGARAATRDDYATEFLAPIIAVAVVDSIDDAMEHVATFGTGHSEAIVTSNSGNAERWVREVDAAAVIVNASTRFIDGGELGLGGEVGISTQKLHARGPMGVRELTCVKWVVRGEGQIR